MSAVEQIDVNAVAPDSVEVVESYRTWKITNGKLVSHNGVVWKPGEALHATCQGGAGAGFEVVLVRLGMSLEKIAAAVQHHNLARGPGYYFSFWGGAQNPQTQGFAYLPEPTVEPPDGYGYEIRPLPHETPSEYCTCGIYSGTTLKVCPEGDVRGKVKLWGKLVPGEKGYRAEYAYPSEFIVPAGLAQDPALLAFGVPITIDDSTPTSIGGLVQFLGTPPHAGLIVTGPPKTPVNRWLRFALFLNLACAAVNATFILARFV